MSKGLHISFDGPWWGVKHERHWYPWGLKPRLKPNMGGGYSFTWLWVQIWTHRG